MYLTDIKKVDLQIVPFATGECGKLALQPVMQVSLRS